MNETAFGILPEEETEWISKVQKCARENQIDIVAKAAIQVSFSPLKIRNVYFLVDRSGKILQKYSKHKPVAGIESILPGQEIAGDFDMGYACIGGAVCFDFDSPRITRENALPGVELAFLPSNDWRAIDPWHTQCH